MYIPALKAETEFLEGDLASPGLLRPSRGPVELSILSDHSPLRWRYGERLDDVIEDACRRHAERIAVSLEGSDITYRELDSRANQMARLFLQRGVRPGDRVAVLLDRGLEAYVALFALMKVRAAYVPLDANHPADRLRFILADAGATLILAHLRLADRFAGSDIPVLVVDRARDDLEPLSDVPLAPAEREAATDPLCYVLYTSGTTGQPKGVAVAHPSICNFVRVAAELYGFAPGDRVYQGMSVAFDFSIEELWVPLVAGATLTPNTAATSLFGEELAEFLERRAVTCFCCVPTLLASIDRDLPGLRILLIGGEACPPALVKRWASPDRALLNSYGPTEATVTATLGLMTPEKPVTIGRPLPTYAIVILDAKRDQALPMGASGEIGIAGIGVAEGYLNRQELTQAKFIEDFLALPNNPSGRIYRTGDLGRINAEGEIEYLGRIDTQVKLRGYRIELTEIESVLLDIPEIAQVVVTTFEPQPGDPELVAYYSIKHGAKAPEPTAILATLRQRLPSYMTPAFLERLPFIPTLVSNKADREKLPAPKSARIRIAESATPPTTATERVLCSALQETLGLEAVSIDGNFFEEYGAHSLLMARFCAKVRHSSPTLHLAMRDIYTNPTVRRLATALDSARPAPTVESASRPVHRPSALAYWLCGAGQLGFYLVSFVLSVAFVQTSVGWTIDSAHSPLTLLARAMTIACLWFFGLTGLAIAAKWTLIGRSRFTEIPLWSFAYFRFWLVRQLVSAAPANALVGTPAYNLFLRALGARIGRNALIQTSAVPFLGERLTVGDDAVLTRRVLAPGYAARGNRLCFGDIRIGKFAYVGEGSVLDIDSAVGDFAQLGHQSSLQSGQRVPDGKRYHGSPAEETTTNFRMVDEGRVSRLRRSLFTIVQIALILVTTGALVGPIAAYVVSFWEAVAPATVNTTWALAIEVAPGAFVAAICLYASSLIVGLALVYVVPRIANRFLEEGRVYPLFGWHHWLQRLIASTSNSLFFNFLFGDSIFIERYLRFVGWRLGKGDSTGSNFGAEQMQDNPFLCEVGAETVASDGLILGNLSISSHSFKLNACKIGERNFLGTTVYAPPGGRIGDNCLLATRVMIPIDGPMRENVGLLGSPAFEIPRAATRDIDRLSELTDGQRKARLVEKTRRNIATILTVLASRLFMVFSATFLLTMAVEIWGAESLPAMTGVAILDSLLTMALFVFMERASLGFRCLKPTIATVYDPEFWHVERFWKFTETPLFAAFLGTPLRSIYLRLIGMKVGRMLFDDGAVYSEATLVVIGDCANLNMGTIVQSHSLEEGVFKSDYIRIGDNVTLGTHAFVHYGVTLNEGTRLDADAFLMKGEITPAGSRWRGNPAKLIGRRAV